MKLQQLTIECHQYGDLKGRYTGTMEYEGERGKVVLTLDPKVSDALLAFIAPTISKFANETCKQLEANIQQSLSEVSTLPLIDQ